tara:strand:+ start:258 stop:818 length:561 start_codon:yes stop_codon:yes gene_type:complete
MNTEQLLKDNERKLFARAVVLTRNQEDAYDLLQTTMEKIFKAQLSLDNENNFLPWAYTIMRNAFYDNMRSRQGIPDQVPFEDYTDPDDSTKVKVKITPEEQGSMANKYTPEDSYVINEKFEFTMKIISQMKPIHRDMINLFMQGNKYEEISKLLNLKIGTVMSTLSRLREKIAIEWELHVNKGSKA